MDYNPNVSRRGFLEVGAQLAGITAVIAACSKYDKRVTLPTIKVGQANLQSREVYLLNLSDTTQVISDVDQFYSLLLSKKEGGIALRIPGPLEVELQTIQIEADTTRIISKSKITIETKLAPSTAGEYILTNVQVGDVVELKTSLTPLPKAEKKTGYEGEAPTYKPVRVIRYIKQQ